MKKYAILVCLFMFTVPDISALHRPYSTNEECKMFGFKKCEKKHHSSMFGHCIQ